MADALGEFAEWNRPMSRLDDLKRSHWRVKMAKAGYGHCRICGGRTWASRPYCRRHFNLIPPVMRHAVASGQQLDDADAAIELAGLRGVVYVQSGCYRVSSTETLRSNSDTGDWRLYFVPVAGAEVVRGRFTNLRAFRLWYIARRHDYSARNRFASKTLIR